MDASLLVPSFQGNAPAAKQEIFAAERSLNIELPDDYKDFLLCMNGGEGFIGDGSYAMLWKVAELQPFNVDYQVAEYCPGILLIGSSGGGEAFGIKTREGIPRYCQVPFVGMEPSLIVAMADSFKGFLLALAGRES